MIEEWNFNKIPNFIGYMNTLFKARKGKEILDFYNNGEYEELNLKTILILVNGILNITKV